MRARASTAAALLAMLFVFVFAASSTAAAPVKTNVIFAFKGKVSCGVNLAQAGGGISCYSEALPSTELDGYVELHARGKAATGERGDSPWRGSAHSRAYLKKGRVWRRAGIRCIWRAALNCTNEQRHGFKLSPTSYTLF